MIDLTQYGFAKIKETEHIDEYQGHECIVTVYHYPYMSFDNKELSRTTFLVTSKRYTSRVYHISELESWLNDRKITKQK